MATSPLTSLAGHNVLSDLLFSSRAAFIWDNSRECVTWMNAAARSRFETCLSAFSNLLSPEAKANFDECIHAAKQGGNGISFLKLKFGRRRAAGWSAEMLELAGGHDGLVVAEASSMSIPPAPGEPPKPVAKLSVMSTGKRKRKKIKRSPVESPRLTAEEERSLKAIGRTVRKLCAQKGQTAGNIASEAAEAVSNASVRSGLTVPALLASAFDLVLFLSDSLEITCCEGRPQRLGWRKSSLQRLPVASILPAHEQAIFYRMVRKLESSSAQICRETLLVCDDAGNSTPCRAILGRHQEEEQIFLALLSMKMPQRLKRFSPQMLSIPSLARLAA